MPAKIVVVQSIGQLGNRLFQFSHLIALAQAQGCQILNPSFSKYAHLFPATTANLFCAYPERHSWVARPWVQTLVYYFIRICYAAGFLGIIPGAYLLKKDWREGPTRMDSDIFRGLVSRFKIIFLAGSFNHKHPENFPQSWPKIRDFFRISETRKLRIKQHLEPLRNDSNILVGVHLRQGDVFTDPVRKDALDQTYYAQKLQEVLALFPGRRVSFLICSNAPIKSGLFSAFQYQLGLGDFVDDLYSLAECDYLLGAGQSSFSLWASKIGNVPRAALFRNQAQALRLSDFQTDFSE